MFESLVFYSLSFENITERKVNHDSFENGSLGVFASRFRDIYLLVFFFPSPEPNGEGFLEQRD